MHTEWFNNARYGLFIHWGAYSVAGRCEWLMNRELIPRNEYQAKYVDHFHAEHYNPADWAAKAKRWGMGYAVFTTRHHDGFALWNSKVNQWNAVNFGPKRDLVAEYVKAFRDAGLKVGLYYSSANWTHPDYPGPFSRNYNDNTWKDEASRKRFIEYNRAEIKELLSNYGKIDYLWFDGNFPGNLDGPETAAMIRKIQPEIIFNDRVGNVKYDWNVKECEQEIKPAAETDIDWEACMTLNHSWAYNPCDHRWKQPTDVIELLLQCARDGGNLLINNGPMPDGTFSEESVKILDAVGIWLKHNREAIANSERHLFQWCNGDCCITCRNNRIYLNFLSDCHGGFCWGDLKNEILRAYFLDNGEEVEIHREGPRLFLPDLKFIPPARTVVLEVNGKPENNFSEATRWIPE